MMQKSIGIAAVWPFHFSLGQKVPFPAGFSETVAVAGVPVPFPFQEGRFFLPGRMHRCGTGCLLLRGLPVSNG